MHECQGKKHDGILRKQATHGDDRITIAAERDKRGQFDIIGIVSFLSHGILVEYWWNASDTNASGVHM